MLKLIIVLSLAFATLSYEMDGKVLKLGETDFDTARGEFPNMLVKFFAPWCGHCKKMAPIYVQAADELAKNESAVRLAEVDCTIHKSLCSKFGVRGYPTVNFFGENNANPIKYSSARTKEAIVNWLNEQTAPKQAEEEL